MNKKNYGKLVIVNIKIVKLIPVKLIINLF